METRISFSDKVTAAFTGGAIGDAMGAPVEGSDSRRLLSNFSDWDFRTFIPPQNWDGARPYGKGNGRITDDTLMTEALMHAYIDAGSHLDAYGYAKHVLRRVTKVPVFVSEWQRETPIFDRLWIPEKLPRYRIEFAGADPRTAGVGNMCNCGVAMWIMPVGAVNAADPWAAYQEAAAIGGAHNESFAVEAAAVLAAAFAEAFGPRSTIERVIAAAEKYAQDGTANAVRAAVAAVQPDASLEAFVRTLRSAIEPFDQRISHESDDQPLATPSVPTDLGRPSRVKSIEELPAALGVLKYGNGDFLKTLRAGVCYGRDCDSIAGMACGLYGAVFGSDAFPNSLTVALEDANRRNFRQIAAGFVQCVLQIAVQDRQRNSDHSEAISSEPRSA